MKEELNKAGVCILASVWLCGCASHAASPSSLQADKVVVAKGQRVLVLMSKENVLKTYHVALGKQPKGPKMREGDGKTPEGHYVIDRRNAKSRFHLALHISYPSVADVQNARKLGVSPGGDIMITWSAERLGLDGGIAHEVGLDRRVYRGYERRDRRNLARRPERNAN